MEKGFTLVEIMIVVTIIALLAAIAMPSLRRANMRANETNAKSILKTISNAAESYAAANGASYPGNLSVLTSATPPYLNRDYTTSTRRGYNFTCGPMNSTGYTCAAGAITCNTTGSRDFNITTGGVMAQADCT